MEIENSGTKITRRISFTTSAKSVDTISPNVQILKREKRRKKKGKRGINFLILHIVKI